MQLQGGSFYKGIIDCTISTWKTEGIKAFYISYPTTLLMSIPFQSIHFASYEAFKKIFNPKEVYDPKIHIISGGLAGAIASVAGNPFDVLKTRMMAYEGSEKRGFGYYA